MDLLGWLIFLFALLFSVMAHEAGHFATAKKFGMKATQFFVGFGPTLWSVRLGETEYGIKALPFGGFVKIIGMTSVEVVPPEDEPRAFRRFPGWQRVIVLSAGSAVHFILAFLLIFGLALGVGIENANSTQLGTISACVPANAAALNADAACPAGAGKSPAGIAGLRVGDEVTSFDGTRVANYTQLTTAIKRVKAGTTVPITVLRDGKSVTVHATLAAVHGRSGGFLGIAGASVFQSVSPLRAVTYAGSGFWQVLSGSAQEVGQLPAALPDLFKTGQGPGIDGGGQRDQHRWRGQRHRAGRRRPGGLAGQGQLRAAADRLAEHLLGRVQPAFRCCRWTAGTSRSSVYERIRSRIARWRRRPDPGMADYMKFIPVSFSLFSIIVLISVILILADIVNPVNIG